MNAMRQVQSVQTSEIQWFAVKMKPNANGGARTARVGVKREAYTTRSGRLAYRDVRGTGDRVFVAEHLVKRAGFEVFLPVKKVWRQKNRYTREKHLVSVPLLADWMFVGMRAAEGSGHSAPGWSDLMSLNVVVGVLGSNGYPIQLSDQAVLEMMVNYSEGRQSHRVRRRIGERRACAVGDEARILQGPFEGCQVQVVDMKGRSARVLLNMLGGDLPVEVETNILSKINKM